MYGVDMAWHMWSKTLLAVLPTLWSTKALQTDPTSNDRAPTSDNTASTNLTLHFVIDQVVIHCCKTIAIFKVWMTKTSYKLAKFKDISLNVTLRAEPSQSSPIFSQTPQDFCRPHKRSKAPNWEPKPRSRHPWLFDVYLCYSASVVLFLSRTLDWWKWWLLRQGRDNILSSQLKNNGRYTGWNKKEFSKQILKQFVQSDWF